MARMRGIGNKKQKETFSLKVSYIYYIKIWNSLIYYLLIFLFLTKKNYLVSYKFSVLILTSLNCTTFSLREMKHEVGPQSWVKREEIKHIIVLKKQWFASLFLKSHTRKRGKLEALRSEKEFFFLFANIHTKKTHTHTTHDTHVVYLRYILIDQALSEAIAALQLLFITSINML
jgi:hypothetical protein